MSGLSAEDREALYPVVRKNVAAYAVVEQILARHVEAFREQAVAAIEADMTFANPTRNATLATAARIIRDLPR